MAESTGQFTQPAARDGHGHAIGPGPQFLVNTPLEQVSSITISLDAEEFTLRRDNAGGWRYGDAPSSEAIGQSLTVFARARIKREITVGRDVAPYGVLRPAMSLSLFGASETKPIARYFFGDLAPDELSRYVMLSGELKVVTIPEYHADNLRQLVAALSPAAPE
ncbi:MAG: hypothetical protein QGF53_15775 [Alphaproteobacteria bacterium]|nr:hypothetical protein [Alphaproteobacteria bacterium]